MNAKIKAADKFSTYHIVLIILLSFTQFTVVLDFMIISPLGDNGVYGPKYRTILANYFSF